MAGFDVSSDLIGSNICGVPIYDIGELAQRQKEYNVSIAILTVPVEHSQEAADMAIKAGIKAIWNFTPFRIKAPANIVIANTSIYAHLAIIYNRMLNHL